MARFNPAKYDPRNDSSPDTDDLRVDGYENDVIIELGAVDGSKLCNCGCGDPLPERKNGKTVETTRFIQGHDARFRGILIRAHLTNTEITVRDGAMQTSSSAMQLATNLDLGRKNAHWVSSLQNAQNTFDAKAAKRTNRSTGKQDAYQLGTIKIGRWEYPARKQGDVIERNTKRDGSGDWQTADKTNDVYVDYTHAFVPAA